MSFTRFAVYYLPPDGELAQFGARWLGWDVALGQPCDQPDLPGIDDVTMTPRKYGFHGTLKPPFRLAEGHSQQDLADRLEQIAGCVPAARCDGLQLSKLGRFLALTPVGNPGGIARVASTLVTKLDKFRAPAGADELARRRAAGLTPEQDALLVRWGYPYVLDEFRFHLTLTGRLDRDELAGWEGHALTQMPTLPAPFELNEVALVGELPDGSFKLIQRYALNG